MAIGTALILTLLLVAFIANRNPAARERYLQAQRARMDSERIAWVWSDEDDYEMTAEEWAALSPVEAPADPTPAEAPKAPAKPKARKKAEPAAPPITPETVEDAPEDDPPAKPKASARVHRDPAPAKVRKAPKVSEPTTIHVTPVGSGTQADADTLARYIADQRARREAA